MLKRFILGVTAVAIFAGALGLVSAPVANAQSDFDYTFEDDLMVTTTAEPTDEDIAAAAGMLMTWMACWSVLVIAMYVIMALALSTIGKKVGATEPSWMAWVPLLNIYYMVRVAGEEAWKLILLFVPVVNFLYGIYLWMKISERRGFASWYGILMILPVLNFVMPLYLAYGEPKGAAPATPVSTPVDSGSDVSAE